MAAVATRTRKLMSIAKLRVSVLATHGSQTPLNQLQFDSHAAHSGPMWPARQPSPSMLARSAAPGHVPFSGQR